MLKDGFISLHRSILKWGWYDNINTTRLFIHLLLTANYYDQEWHGVTIKRGQIVTSVDKLSKKSTLTIQQTRTAITHLISTNEITIQTTPKYTVITISQYEKYQDATNKSTNNQQTIPKKSTNNQQQSNKANNNSNKAINNISQFLTLGSQKNIKITQEELDKLRIEFPNECDDAIEFLSLYIIEKGDKSKSKTHNLTIRRWVIDAIKEKRTKQKTKTKIGNVGNFEQREYSAEYYNNMYVDLSKYTKDKKMEETSGEIKTTDTGRD